MSAATTSSRAAHTDGSGIPGYSGAIVAALTSGVALGSWLSGAVGALGVPLVLWRTVAEDRLLRAELSGYEDYAQRVPYRLVPGLW